MTCQQQPSMVLYYSAVRYWLNKDKPMWRNWQTHQTQNLTMATLYEFKSRHRHGKPVALRGVRQVFYAQAPHMEVCC